MALYEQSYTPPGVETTENFVATSAALVGTSPIPVFIGEGEEFFTKSNVEMHRGSSATSDDQVVGENLSAQVNGTTRVFQLSHFPVVLGDGTGTVTNDPTKVRVLAAGIPLTLLALNGATGQVTAQTIVPPDTNVTAQYYFKRTDTYIQAESLAAQVPAFATLAVAPSLALTLSIPGELGNLISFALTEAATGSGVSDAQAVTGVGTDVISIELRNPDDSIRSYVDVATIISAGIPTQDGGYLAVVSSANVPAVAFASTHFTGGAGPSSNTIFKVANTPIVDGSNGGIVTNNASDVTAEVNGTKVAVVAVDGANGLVTLAAPVAYGTIPTVSYYTNTYKDTGDQIPDVNVAAITKVGVAPNGSNFIEGVDYVLENGSINWGASAITAAATSSAGFTPLDASVINTTLVDQKVYLRPVTGIVNSKNSTFVLQDTPVDGSGLDRATSNPNLLAIYVGVDPIQALQAGPVKVASMIGAAASVTLYNPPTTGNQVYASYSRSLLDDHTFTLAVATAGIPGQGTFTATDEHGRVVPVVSLGATQVSNENFADTGVVSPNNFPDFTAAIGAADETITLTFQDDGLVNIITPSSQASLTVHDGGGVARVTFRATTPGVAGNNISLALLGGGAGAADAAAISVSGDEVTVNTVMADGHTTRTWAQVVALFATYPPTAPGAGVILCAGVPNADLTTQTTVSGPTNLAGGVNQVSQPYAQRYVVTSSRTAAAALADGLGRTGGVTTPVGANWATGDAAAGVGLNGFLGQTYVDPVTAATFTIVDPKAALSFGYTQLPSPSYSFVPGDTLTFVVSRETAHVTGAVPTIAIPGLQTQVVTTYGMNPGDTATINTFNKAGNTPSVGDYYYVTYTTAKAASDYGLVLYDTDTDLYKVAGQPSITNRLSLAAYFHVLNGGGQFGAIQVPAQAGLGVASDQSFIDAIQTLSKPFAGSKRKADKIIPMSTSATVQQAVNSFMAKQAGPRYKGEATSYIGFNQFTTPTIARATASAIASQRVVAVAPFAFGVMLSSSPTAPAVEQLVTGEFVAAAMAGLACNGTNDPATTLTGQTIVGFTRAFQTYDDPTMDLMAASGLTCLVEVPGGLEIRHFKTTDPSNALTSEPYVTTSADFIAQTFRQRLNQFKGRKEVSGLTTTIAQVSNSLMSGWLNNLISGFNPVVVTQDPNDPTTVDVTISYQPMWSLLWINVTFTINLG